jgi:hypothetical protein
LDLGDGTHQLPVTAQIQGTLGEQAGDSVTVHLTGRLEKLNVSS